MNGAWLFLAAYAASGLAGLIYEVAWVRTFTLYMGHTTAATSTVVAAFMGGMAAGAALGGRVASRLTPRRALIGYALLESIVVLMAMAMPFALGASTPVLTWAYRDGAPGVVFPIVRLLLCLAVLMPPTAALGATFPFAVRWFVSASDRTGQSAGRLYAANTAGAAIGTLGAGFLLIPVIGVIATTLVGVAASVVAIVVVLIVARRSRVEPADGSAIGAPRTENGERSAPSRAQKPRTRRVDEPPRRWLAGAVLALTGFATFLYEIAWTRVFSSILGPSTYAFAATVTGFIAGLAVGSAVGSALAGRVRRPEFPLAIALGAAALAASWASAYAGGLPLAIAEQLAGSPQTFGQQLFSHSVLAAALVAPTAIGLGIAFPLALEIAGARDRSVAARLGAVYAINTLASVGGSLAAGFVALPMLGLQNTLRLADSILMAGALVVLAGGTMSRRARIIGLVPTAVAAGVLLWSQPWDRALLASGGYRYAPCTFRKVSTFRRRSKRERWCTTAKVPPASCTVKRLTGELSLAIDGKVDASTGGDMLTQKTLAHLPLLLHATRSNDLHHRTGKRRHAWRGSCPSGRERGCRRDLAGSRRGIAVHSPSKIATGSPIAARG